MKSVLKTIIVWVLSVSLASASSIVNENLGLSELSRSEQGALQYLKDQEVLGLKYLPILANASDAERELFSTALELQATRDPLVDAMGSPSHQQKRFLAVHQEVAELSRYSIAQKQGFAHLSPLRISDNLNFSPAASIFRDPIVFQTLKKYDLPTYDEKAKEVFPVTLGVSLVPGVVGFVLWYVP